MLAPFNLQKWIDENRDISKTTYRKQKLVC